jgi:hypothetical protein
MVKKAPVVKSATPDSTKQLVDAIVTVKNLQSFIADHGSLEKALEAVARVQKMIDLTGGFDQLRQALQIVGRENGPCQESAGT